MIDVSAVVNLHREGALCGATLRSVARAVEFARGEGFSCEIVIALDRGDDATRAAIAEFGEGARVEPCDLGDLGGARNFGAARARGAMIGFMDGDDIMGERWLAVAARTARAHDGRDVVVHPRYEWMFGGGEPPTCLVLPDMIEDRVSARTLVFANLWTSLVFAKAELFRTFPYPSNELGAGFGYEDWSWNFATVNAGVLHLTAREGVHFRRRKSEGSLHALSLEAAVLPNLWPRGPRA